MANLKDLVKDIQNLFTKPHVAQPANVTALGTSLAKIVSDRLSEDRSNEKPTLRMSNIGWPDRKLWFLFNHTWPPEQLSFSAKVKFLYGDLLERLLLFFAREAGHEVTNEQAAVNIDGIVGHKDADIDGVTVDTKSASTYSFRKFSEGTLRDDDAFGYIGQLSGYAHDQPEGGAFLAIDKTLGHIALLPITKEELDVYNIRDRIAVARRVVEKSEPPDFCYEDRPEGKSGNRVLAVGCSYCPFKRECWAQSNEGRGLRLFLYSTSPKWFTQVLKEPNVPELTLQEQKQTEIVE